MDYYETTEPYLHLMQGNTIKDNGRVLGCWGWVLEEPWIALADDLSFGDTRFIVKQIQSWVEVWDWAIKRVSLQADDPVARRFMEFLGFEKFDQLTPEIVRYERSSNGRSRSHSRHSRIHRLFGKEAEGRGKGDKARRKETRRGLTEGGGCPEGA